MKKRNAIKKNIKPNIADDKYEDITDEELVEDMLNAGMIEEEHISYDENTDRYEIEKDENDYDNTQYEEEWDGHDSAWLGKQSDLVFGNSDRYVQAREKHRNKKTISNFHKIYPPLGDYSPVKKESPATFNSKGVKAIEKFDCLIPREIVAVMERLNQLYEGVEYSIAAECKFDTKRKIFVLGNEFMIPKQKVSSAQVDYITTDYGRFNCIIHKHPSSVKKFSSTDEDYINQNFEASLLWVDRKFEYGICNIYVNFMDCRIRVLLNPVIEDVALDFSYFEDSAKKLIQKEQYQSNYRYINGVHQYFPIASESAPNEEDSSIQKVFKTPSIKFTKHDEEEDSPLDGGDFISLDKKQVSVDKLCEEHGLGSF